MHELLATFATDLPRAVIRSRWPIISLLFSATFAHCETLLGRMESVVTMKRSYLAAIFLLFGIVCGAHLITQAPGATASPLVASETEKARPAKAQAAAAMPPAPAPVPTARTAAPVPTARTATITRPPVPLLLSPRPAITKAESETTLPETAASDTSQANPQSDSFAKAAIEQDGYKGVRGITKGPNGSWRATAMRGTTEVILRVDANGNVSAQ
jgi:hypothetical protein